MNTVSISSVQRRFIALRRFARAVASAPVHNGCVRMILAGLVIVGLVSFETTYSAFAANASYRCSDGTTVGAVFRGLGQTGSVQLTFAGRGRPITIPQAPSADGGRYANGDTEFWIKGTTARLTRQGATTDCKAALRS
jgi:membrane-bound inhibitor of C-type lysozyme